MKSRFPNESQKTVLALSNVVYSESPTEENQDEAARFCGVEKELVMSEKAILKHMDFSDEPSDENSPLFELITWFEKHKMFDLLPNFGSVLQNLGVIPVTSCTAERSFSSMRQILNYMRATMGEERFNDIAVMYCNRDISNEVIKHDIDKIIDCFAQRSDKSKIKFSYSKSVLIT